MNKKVVAFCIGAVVVVSASVAILLNRDNSSYEDYINDSVKFDEDIDSVSNTVTVKLPDDLSMDTVDLPESIKGLVVLGSEDENSMCACYYAATETFGDDVDFELSDSLVWTTYEGYNSRMFLINGKDTQFAFNDSEVIILR